VQQHVHLVRVILGCTLLLLLLSFFPVLVVVVDCVGDCCFVLADSLLENIQGPRDDFKLSDDFFEGHREFLT
jgi:hypothetical protein